MPIETKCPGCQRPLRVQDEHAGKQARCPMCNTIYLVPVGAGSATAEQAGGNAAGAVQSDAAAAWFMKTPEGQMFGPVDKPALDRWVSEGRVTADCELRLQDESNWQAADRIYPILRPAPQNFRAASPPDGEFRASPRRLVPHRGPLILALGILGWFTCPVFSVMAWVMGNSDLREMQAGRMDAGGMGLTQAGQVLGMILSMIWIVIFVLAMFFLVLGVATS